MLTLGTDLTSLGLNLNASESLHRSFASPLSDTPVKQEPEFELPSCYQHVPQRLLPGYIGEVCGAERQFEDGLHIGSHLEQ